MYVPNTMYTGSFVRSWRAGVLWTPALRGDLISVRGVRDTQSEGGKVGLSSLSGISKRAPSRHGLVSD